MRRKAAAPTPEQASQAPRKTRAGKVSGGGGSSSKGPGFAALLRQTLSDKLGKENVSEVSRTGDLIGLPLEGKLPLQYLLGTSCLPLSRILSLIGGWGSYKTTVSLGLFGKLFLENSGYVVYITTEHKTNWTTVDAQFTDMPDYRDGIMVVSAKSTEKLLSSMYQPVQTYLSAGATEPLAVVVDSLGGITSDAANEATEKSGLATDVAGHDQQRRARTITEQYRVISGKVAEGNVFLLVLNHEKEKTNSTTPSFIKEKTWIGGDHQNFAYSWIIAIKKTGSHETQAEKRVTLRLQTTKSTYSPEKQNILVDLCFRKDINTATLQASLDWDSALTNLVMSDRVSAAERKMVGLQAVSGQKGKFTLARLAGDELLTAEEAGNLMHNTPEVVDLLQRIFGVVRIKEYRNGEIVPPTVFLPLEPVQGPEKGPEQAEQEEDVTEE